jgi:hypothetical protein
MCKVLLDPEFQAKLNNLKEQLEICDETGRTLGHFLPAEVYRKLLYAALAGECPHSAEELERRHKEKRGRPLAEIWKRLGRP